MDHSFIATSDTCGSNYYFYANTDPINFIIISQPIHTSQTFIVSPGIMHNRECVSNADASNWNSCGKIRECIKFEYEIQ